MKKILAITIGLTVLAWVGGPILDANAYTGITAGFTFAKNLSSGMNDPDVVNLKIVLANEGCVSGLANTDYFASKTLAGAQCFCNKYKAEISTAAGYTVGCTGLVGTGMRAKLNALIGGEAPVPGATPTPASTPSEGTFTVAIAAEPVSRTVNAGNDIQAYGFNVTALGSDITIGKLDLQTAVVNAVTAVTYSPATIITRIKVYDTTVSDTNLKATFNSPTFTMDTAGRWYTSLTGLNFLVSQTTTKKLLVVIDVTTAFDQNRTVTLNVYGNNGIRGRDTAGIDTFVALATTRILTLQRPGLATLTISANSANPYSNNIYSDTTVGVQDAQSIMVFNAKATAGDAALSRIEVTYVTGASEAIPSILYLYDGGSLVASATPGATENGVATFESFGTYPIAQNATKTFTVKAAWNAIADSSVNGFTPTIPVSVAANTRCIYARSDGSIVGCINPTAVVGNTQWVFEQGTKITFVSAPTPTGRASTTTQTGTSSGTFTFTVQPFGGSLSQIQHASQTSGIMDMVWVEAYWTSGSAIGTSVADGTLTRSVSQNPARNLNDGESGTVTVTMGIESTTSYGLGTLRFKLEGITWNVGGLAGIQAYQGNGSGGNVTDDWFTPWYTMN